MKINYIIGKDGCAYHRIFLPLRFTRWSPEDQFTMVPAEDIGKMPECDLIVFNRCIPTVPLDKIEEWAYWWKNRGTKIVVDLDDYWEIPSDHVLYKNWYKSKAPDHFKISLQIADMVWVTNEQLRNKVLPYNKNVIIIPNAMPFGEENYNSDLKVESDKTRFLYAGGSTHLPDVKLLSGKFKRIASDKSIRDNSEFILAGYQDHPLGYHGEWASMKSIFDYTGCSTIKYSKPLEEYLTFYDEADVVLVPLHQSEFSACKSILKILEAATRSLPVICSKVLPYTELESYPGIMWVENNNWLDHIRYSIKNPEFVKDSGAQLTEKLKEKYNLLDWAEVRYQLMEHLINR